MLTEKFIEEDPKIQMDTKSPRLKFNYNTNGHANQKVYQKNFRDRFILVDAMVFMYAKKRTVSRYSRDDKSSADNGNRNELLLTV